MNGIYVNILKEGFIPGLNEVGPLFGYCLPYGAYLVLLNQGLRMEVTDKALADKRYREYMERKSKANEAKSVDEGFKKTMEECDKLLEESKKIDAAKAQKVENAVTEPETAITYKTVDELETMTWTELREYMTSINVAFTRGETKKRLINKLIRLKKV